jgi:hypothetical protein
MQRRRVLLPEPDGLSTVITARGHAEAHIVDDAPRRLSTAPHLEGEPLDRDPQLQGEHPCGERIPSFRSVYYASTGD